MNLKPKTLILIALAVFVVLFGTIFLTTCKSPASSDDLDDTATVSGCNQVSYGGFTYSVTGCDQQGVASFDVTISQNGHTASFHITCSGGCISTAVPF